MFSWGTESGMAMKSTEMRHSTTAMIFPTQVTGAMSQVPTVVTVTVQR